MLKLVGQDIQTDCSAQLQGKSTPALPQAGVVPARHMRSGAGWRLPECHSRH